MPAERFAVLGRPAAGKRVLLVAVLRTLLGKKILLRNHGGYPRWLSLTNIFLHCRHIRTNLLYTNCNSMPTSSQNTQPELRTRKQKHNEFSDTNTSSKTPEKKLPDPLEKSVARELLQHDLSVFAPSFGTVFKVLVVVRFISALISNISDCDEVFNYWEDSHFLQYGYGLQTWEYSPDYAIRSWAYIGMHAILGSLASLVISNKMQVFYIIRLMLSTVCAYAETCFYRAVVEEINPRIGRYVLMALLGSAGMFNASAAFLPSSFAMYTTMMAFTHTLQIPTNFSNWRTIGSVFWLGIGGLLGWPFSAAVGLPFAIEEIFVLGDGVDTLAKERKNGNRRKITIQDIFNWRTKRMIRLLQVFIVLVVIILFPITVIDGYFYQKNVIIPWNIIKYNIFGGKDRGPDIYGTEPWSFYFLNGLLNFNILFIFALASFPVLLITWLMDNSDSINIISSSPVTNTITTSPYTLLVAKMSPLYLWLAIFTFQSHKEERFLFVIYPLICLNAAIALFFLRRWMQKFMKLLGIKLLMNQKLLTLVTTTILFLSSLISISRIYALYVQYHAPLDIYTYPWIHPEILPNTTGTILNFCVGKEWYRFPSSYFLPDNARLRFLKSEFHGLLPKPFLEDFATTGETDSKRQRLWKWEGAHKIPQGMNDLNREELDRYIDPAECHFLVDVDFPERYEEQSSDLPPLLEPRYIKDSATWEELNCELFLDAARSSRWARIFWVPGTRGKSWGRYCLLRRKSLPGLEISRKE